MSQIEKVIFETNYLGTPINIAADLKIVDDNAPTVLGIHGLGLTKEDLDPFKRHQSFDDMNVVLIDLPRHGESTRDVPRQVYWLNNLAGVVYQMISQLNQPNLHLFGHSFGASLTVKIGKLIMENKDQSLKSISFAEPNLVNDDSQPFSKIITSIGREHINPYVLKGVLHPIFYGPSNSSAERAYFEDIRDVTNPNTFAKMYYECCRTLVEWSSGDKLLKTVIDLHQKGLHTSYMYGGKSTIPIMQQEEYSNHVTEWFDKIVKFPNAGHFLPSEAPQLYEELPKFISEIS